MTSHIEQRSGPRKMSGEDQMMFQDHVPFVDKVRSVLRSIDELPEYTI